MALVMKAVSETQLLSALMLQRSHSSSNSCQSCSLLFLGLRSPPQPPLVEARSGISLCGLPPTDLMLASSPPICANVPSEEAPSTGHVAFLAVPRDHSKRWQEQKVRTRAGLLSVCPREAVRTGSAVRKRPSTEGARKSPTAMHRMIMLRVRRFVGMMLLLRRLHLSAWSLRWLRLSRCWPSPGYCREQTAASVGVNLLL